VGERGSAVHAAERVSPGGRSSTVIEKSTVRGFREPAGHQIEKSASQFPISAFLARSMPSPGRNMGKAVVVVLDMVMVVRSQSAGDQPSGTKVMRHPSLILPASCLMHFVMLQWGKPSPI